MKSNTEVYGRLWNALKIRDAKQKEEIKALKAEIKKLHGRQDALESMMWNKAIGIVKKAIVEGRMKIR
jgi:hypothetical protein